MKPISIPFRFLVRLIVLSLAAGLWPSIGSAVAAGPLTGLADDPERSAETAGDSDVSGVAAVALRVVSHNLWDGFTKKPEPRHARWLEWMTQQRPDVVALQELNGYTPERLAAEARTWGHAYSVLLKEDGHPTGLTSRTPITEVERIREGMHHGLLHGKTAGIHFYVIHFHPSHYGRRIEEAGRLLNEITRLPEDNPRVVLIGDFNGFSPDDRASYERDPDLEPFFAKLDGQHPDARNLNGGKLDYGGIKRILDAGYIDPITKVRFPDGPFRGTFPTALRSEEELGSDRRIDYAFVSPNLASAIRSARILRDETTAMLSDHYPVMLEIELKLAARVTPDHRRDLGDVQKSIKRRRVSEVFAERLHPERAGTHRPW